MHPTGGIGDILTAAGARILSAVCVCARQWCAYEGQGGQESALHVGRRNRET